MPVIGSYHRDDGLKTPERHLGLTPVTEIETADLIRHMGEDAGKWVDTEKLLAIARSAAPLMVEEEEEKAPDVSVRIGVAKDEAFSFYYPASLHYLERLGAELVPFSPLRDSAVPDVDGLIFGGGFPEMFLHELEDNTAMKDSIRKAAEGGMPIYAECGGLMYLCEKIQGFDGDSYDMAGLVPGVCEMQKKLQRVQPDGAKDGYLYFQLDTGDASANAPVLVIGLEKSRFFADAIPVHILLTIPEHGVSIQLTGTVSAQTVVLTAPTSRMKDEDIQTLVQIRDTIQSVLQFVQTAANSVQNAG